MDEEFINRGVIHNSRGDLGKADNGHNSGGDCVRSLLIGSGLGTIPHCNQKNKYHIKTPNKSHGYLDSSRLDF